MESKSDPLLTHILWRKTNEDETAAGLLCRSFSLTQIVECFLHRPGTKSRKYKNGRLCCQHKERRATFALLAEMKKTPLLWKTWRNGPLSLSWDNVSSENEVSSNRPGSRKQQPKVPLANRPLSQFLAITLDINKSSPSLGCKRHSKWFLKSRWTRQRRHTKRHKSWGCWRRVKGKAIPHFIPGPDLHPFLSHPIVLRYQKTLVRNVHPGVARSLRYLPRPFSPVPPGSLFLGGPRVGPPLPRGFIKSLVTLTTHSCFRGFWSIIGSTSCYWIEMMRCPMY